MIDYLIYIFNNVVKEGGSSPILSTMHDKCDTSGYEMYFHFIKLENDSDLLEGRSFHFFFSSFTFYFITVINLIKFWF